MQKNYKPLGDFIQPIKVKNSDLSAKELLGINVDKFFMPSVANIVGTDLSNYKVVNKNQFACNRMHVGRDYRIPIALSDREEPFMVSPAYDVFEIIDTSILHPDYLMMWFSRKEYDRNAWFYTDADVRGGLAWEAFCNMKFPLPSPEKQREIVAEYTTVNNRIELNNKLIQKLEETAQAIYKHWFVDFEFPDENGNPYKSSGGAMVYNEELDKEIPEGWENSILSKIATIIMGQSPVGESYNEDAIGVPLVNGPVEFGEYFTVKTKWTTEPKKYCKKNDLIFCVRGSTVGRHVIADDKYAIGRGVCAINSKYQLHLLQLIKFNLAEILKDVTGSTFPNIDRMTLGNYPIIIGGDEILKKFEEKLFPTNQMILLKSKENQMLSELKNLLLSKLATIKN
ncbi:MAG: restriction endonuclease subunit S [Paludibacter sp.]|nr:restriction endonuclease subunit S [Paludibacter sp.]